MTAGRQGHTPLRRGVGAVLVVLLLVGAVAYYRASTSVEVAALTPNAAPSSVGDRDPSATTAASPTPTISGQGGSPPARVGTIQMYADQVIAAKPFETVRIRGIYHGVAETALQLERREGTRWIAFPLPPRTDHLGRFITHVEIGQPGPHWLRVVDPRAGVSSEPFVLEIRR